METIHRHKKFKGEAKTRQQKRSIAMRGNVDKSKQNDAGYYEGMPGVTTDEYGNRVFMSFIVTPDAHYTTLLFGHPEIVKDAIVKAMQSNVMIKETVKAATFKAILEDKTLINWLFLQLYKIQFKKIVRKGRKKQERLHRQKQINNAST